MTVRPLRVAILGAGTVGREVIRGFLEQPDLLRPVDGSPLVVVGVAVRDADRARAAGIPDELLSTTPAHLVASPETDVIVELMGGDQPAHTLVAAALAAGKAVVTANKHLIAHHGAELEAIARQNGVALRFEAAVGGGIPVLGPLAADLAANRVEAVRGIVNGTTNYILTQMADEGRTYAEVLADAQAAGYAEADPAGDVEGLDAANKLVILARLAFGAWIEPDRIPRVVSRIDGGPGSPGITGVTPDDLAAAAAAGYAIKLIASASASASPFRASGAHPTDDRAVGRIVASVLPTAVPAGSPLARTAGVLNRIEIDAVPVGRLAFSGPGAGGSATASAVLGDLLAIARELGSTWAGLGPASATPARDGTAQRDIGPPGSGDGPTAAPASTDGWFAGPSGARYPIHAVAG